MRACRVCEREFDLIAVLRSCDGDCSGCVLVVVVVAVGSEF